MNNTRLTAFFLLLLPFALNAVDIVVTASRIEEDSSTVSAVVTVIDEEDLEDEASVLSALGKVPEVDVNFLIPGSQSVSMGGFTDNGYARVLVLIDGNPVNRPDMSTFNWLSLPIEKVERIEVIQGGSSAMYGDQAVAGVINIITKRGDDTSVTVKAGADSRLSNNLSLTGQLSRDDFSLFSSISRSDTNSSRENGDYSQWSVSLSPSLKKEILSLGGEIYYTPSEYDMPGGLTEAQYKDDPNQSTNPDDTCEAVDYGVNGRADFDLDNGSVGLPFSVTVQSKDVNWDSSMYESVLTDMDFRPQGTREYWLDDSCLEGTVGFDSNYSILKVDIFNDEAHKSLKADGTTTRYILSPWAVLKFSYRDNILVDTGLRYTYSSLETSTSTDLDDSNDASPLVYSGAVTWLPLEGMKTFVSYDYVYRLPLLDEQASFYGTIWDSFTPLDPEYGHSVTLGLEAWGENWKVSLAPYYIYMFDEIYYDMVEWANMNGAETKRLGANLSGSYDIGIFELGAGYSYVDGTYASGDNEGNQITLVSPHKITGSVKVNLPEGFSVSTNGTWYSSYYRGGDEANDQDQIEGRNNLGVKMGWISDFGLDVTFFVDNLLDCRTPSYVYGSSWYPTEERVFGVQAAWTY